jgi:prepilin-type processing-associated H-X9-DG protein
MFDTIATPNLYNDRFAYCSRIGSGARSDLSNSDSWHPGGVNVAMADGSVKFIKDSINIKTWMSLGTKSNGKVISSDSY